MRNAGYTLIEILLSVSLLFLVLGFSFVIWDFFTSTYYSSFDESKEVTAATQTLSQIQRYVREMQPGENGAYPLETTLDDELAFYADYDSDGTVERLRYFALQNTLRRGVTEPSGSPATYDSLTEKEIILLSALSTGGKPIFSYYNDAWPGDTVNNPLLPADRNLETRLIRISIPVSYADSIDTEPEVASGSVYLRGL